MKNKLKSFYDKVTAEAKNTWIFISTVAECGAAAALVLIIMERTGFTKYIFAAFAGIFIVNILVKIYKLHR